MFLTSSLSLPRAGASNDPAHDFWFEPVGQRAMSGAIVNTDTAMRLSTIYKCVKVRAESLAILPRHAYQHDNQRTRVRDHWLVNLLSKRPNQWQTPVQFVGMLEAHKQLRGTAYAEIYWGRGDTAVTDLVPIHPNRVTPEVTDAGLPRFRVRPANGRGPERVLVPGEIMVLAGLSMDGYTGINPIEAEREAIGAAIAARDYGGRFWANDAKPPFWVEIPGNFGKSDDARTLREDWVAKYGGVNRHKPAMLDRGMKIHELSINNADAQWIEARKFSDIDITGLWRVPPHKVGVLDRATWGNIEHQQIEFVTDCVLVDAVCWEQTIARDLLGEDDDLYVEFLVEQLLRGDTKTRYEAYGKAIVDGWMTRNEARARENMHPLPGLDEPLQPLNMTPVGRALGAPGMAVQTPARAAMLLGAACDRITRKEHAALVRLGPAASLEAVSDFFAEHVRFVAQVLAVSEASAQRYCQAACDRAQHLARIGQLAALPAATWIDTQVTALLRLED